MTVVWIVGALAVGWALWTLFPSNARQSRNIRRNASRPIGSTARSWSVAGIVIAAAIVLVGLWALRGR